jgi:hypothetical protein
LRVITWLDIIMPSLEHINKALCSLS